MSLDVLIEKWSGGPVTVSSPGNLVFRTPGGDAIAIRTEAVSDGEATLRSTWTAPPELASDSTALEGLAQTTTMMGPALLSCSAKSGGVEIAMPVYLEGLSRQELLGAIAEVGRAHWILQSSAAELLVQQTFAAGARMQGEEMAAIVEKVEQAQRELEALEAQPAATGAEGGWAATHTVPEGGMPAWVTPDPSAAPATVLAARVELQVRERRGDWAHVVGANGWSGWVDVRGLVLR